MLHSAVIIALGAFLVLGFVVFLKALVKPEKSSVPPIEETITPTDDRPPMVDNNEIAPPTSTPSVNYKTLVIISPDNAYAVTENPYANMEVYKSKSYQFMRPALRYHGGKYRLSPWIISHFPDHQIYVEPYGGGASVLLRKSRCYSEVYNDLEDEVVNVFRMLRDHGPELRRRLALTPYARAEYDRARGKEKTRGIEKARRMIVRSFMGFGSDSTTMKSSGFRSNSNRSGTTPAHDWMHYAQTVHEITERLQGIVIEHRDALTCIKDHDSPKTLFYVDPPYTHETRTSAKRYIYEMDDDAHRKLAEVLNTVKGMVILSGYDCPLYSELYDASWTRVSKETLVDSACKRIETLYINRHGMKQGKML